MVTTKFMNTFFLACLALGATSVLTGCNTFEGAGQDIQNGGEAIEDAAQDNK